MDDTVTAVREQGGEDRWIFVIKGTRGERAVVVSRCWWCGGGFILGGESNVEMGRNLRASLCLAALGPTRERTSNLGPSAPGADTAKRWVDPLWDRGRTAHQPLVAKGILVIITGLNQVVGIAAMAAPLVV